LPYLFVSVLSLYFFYAFHRTGKNRNFYLSIALAILAFYTRLNGIALLGAYCLYFLWNRQWRRFTTVFLLGAVFTAPWVIRYFSLQGGQTSEISTHSFLLKDVTDPSLGSVTLKGFLLRSGFNVLSYGSWVLSSCILGIEKIGIDSWMGLGFLVLIIWGAWKGRYFREKFLRFYLILSGFIIFAWPPIWTDKRFLLPLLPFLFVYFIQGWFELIRLLSRGRAKALLFSLLLAIMGLIYLVPLLASTPSRWSKNVRYLGGDPTAPYPQGMAQSVEAALWSKENLPKGSVFVTRKPKLFYVFSGHKALPYPYVRDASTLHDFLMDNRVDYIHFNISRTYDRQYLSQFVTEYRDEWQIMHSTSEPRQQILVFHPDAMSGTWLGHLEAQDQVPVETDFQSEELNRAMNLSYTAMIHLSRKEFDQAESFFEASLEIYEGILEPTHPRVLECMTNLALTKKQLENYPEAEQHYERVLSTWLSLGKRDFPYAGQIVADYIEVLKIQGKWAEAETLKIRIQQ
jgi:tetratricopeptide (TPR) repeat protein